MVHNGEKIKKIKLRFAGERDRGERERERLYSALAQPWSKWLQSGNSSIKQFQNTSMIIVHMHKH